MQPHRYTRLNDLMDDFCNCFNDADAVMIADVYEAGESPIEGADKEHLAQGIKEHGHKDAQVLPSVDRLAGMVAEIAEDGDYVICLGAGDISKWAYDLPEQLNTEFAKKQKLKA